MQAHLSRCTRLEGIWPSESGSHVPDCGAGATCERKPQQMVAAADVSL